MADWFLRRRSSKRSSRAHGRHSGDRRPLGVGDWPTLLRLEPLERRQMLSAGSLDLTFGGQYGKIFTSVGSSYDTGSSVVVQSDGKMVVAGSSLSGTNFDFAVVRYNADGSLDTSFGGDGKVLTPIGNFQDFASGVSLQVDGKIVVVGSSYSDDFNNPAFAVVRYNSDGSLDTTFDGDGIAVTNVGSFGGAGSVAVQSDGKIVVAGYSHDGFDSDFALVRYNADGSLDANFDGDGVAVTNVGSFGGASSVAVQADGRIVVAGYSYDGIDSDFALVRYNADGSLDATFDADGIAVTPIGGAADQASGVAVQADGKIVVAGYSFIGTNYDFAVARYNVNGSLDISFDGDGKSVTPVGSTDDYASSVAVQSDGKIVVAGTGYDGSDSGFALVRYNADGSLDTSFDGDGIAVTNVGSFSGASSAAMQSDGKIVVAGYSYDGDYDFAVVRYNADGTLNESFNGRQFDYKSIMSFGRSDKARAVAVQDDGKLVVAGSTYDGGDESDFAVIRYNRDGSLDTSFDGDGKVLTSIGTYDAAYSVAVQADGKILVAGHSSYTCVVVRYNTDGSLDPTFDGDGIAVGGFGGIAHSVAVQADGKILVAVSSPFHFGNDSDFAVVRYNTDGSFDASFDGDGLVVTPIDSSTDNAYSLAVQADGKIVVAGTSFNGSGWDFAVLRYNTDGSLDTSFDTDGKVLTPIGSYFDGVTTVAVQADGKIVLAGSLDDGTHWDFAVVRYNTDGSLDTSFDGDGKALTPAGRAITQVDTSMVLQADGKIVVAGTSYDEDYSNPAFAVVRYNADGSLDTNFDGDGEALTPIGRFSDQVTSMVLQADGKIVIAGCSSYDGFDDNFIVVRYNADGSLDKTAFLRDTLRGLVITGVDGDARAVAMQADGKIVVTGNSFNGTSYDLAVVRYNADGSLDSSFDSDGKVFTQIGSSQAAASSVAMQADGKIVVAGNSLNGTNFDFAVVRYNADGSPDTSFDGDGMVLMQGSSQDFASSVAVQTDGKVLIALTRYDEDYNNPAFAVVRYNADGSLDTSFDGDGMALTLIGSSGFASSVATQANSKIVVAGSRFNGTDYDFAVVRYNEDGSLDNSFGGNGEVVTPVGSSNDVAYSVTVQTDGKIVVAGYSLNGNRDNFAVTRYDSDGSLDTSFDGDGKSVTPLGDSDEYGQSVAVQADGKIVVAGTSYSGSTAQMVVVRYNGDGSLDVAFGDGGRATDEVGDYSIGNAAALQTDGKIVVAGYIREDGKEGFGVARFNGAENVAPIADAGGPYSITEGDPVDLDASGSHDPDGTISSYTWDVNGDGAYDDATGMTPTLSWAELQALGINAGPATYQVRVQVIDSDGDTTTSAPSLLTILNTAPRLGSAAVTMSGSASLHPAYTVPTGDGEQLRTVPVGNLDSISISFPEDVNVTLGDLSMSGLNFGPYTFTGFSYSQLTFTATWTLAAPIGADELTLTLSDNVTDLFGAALDGEWDNPTDLLDTTSSTQAGDGLPGGDFVFRFTVLPGDANRDNQVTGADYSLWADNYGTPNVTFEQGDFTGDGQLTPADYTLWADNFGLNLTGAANTPARSERSHGIAAPIPILAPLQSPRDVESQSVPLLAPRSASSFSRAIELPSETRRAPAQTEQNLPAARFKPDAAEAHDAALLGWGLDSLRR